MSQRKEKVNTNEVLDNLITLYQRRATSAEERAATVDERLNIIQSLAPTIVLWKTWASKQKRGDLKVDQLVTKQLQIKESMNLEEECICAAQTRETSLSKDEHCVQTLLDLVIKERMIRRKIRELEKREAIYSKLFQKMKLSPKPDAEIRPSIKSKTSARKEFKLEIESGEAERTATEVEFIPREREYLESVSSTDEQGVTTLPSTTTSSSQGAIVAPSIVSTEFTVSQPETEPLPSSTPVPQSKAEPPLSSIQVPVSQSKTEPLPSLAQIPVLQSQIQVSQSKTEPLPLATKTPVALPETEPLPSSTQLSVSQPDTGSLPPSVQLPVLQPESSRPSSPSKVPQIEETSSLSVGVLGSKVDESSIVKTEVTKSEIKKQEGEKPTNIEENEKIVAEQISETEKGELQKGEMELSFLSLAVIAKRLSVVVKGVEEQGEHEENSQKAINDIKDVVMTLKKAERLFGVFASGNEPSEIRDLGDRDEKCQCGEICDCDPCTGVTTQQTRNAAIEQAHTLGVSPSGRIVGFQDEACDDCDCDRCECNLLCEDIQHLMHIPCGATMDTKSIAVGEDEDGKRAMEQGTVGQEGVEGAEGKNKEGKKDEEGKDKEEREEREGKDKEQEGKDKEEGSINIESENASINIVIGEEEEKKVRQENKYCPAALALMEANLKLGCTCGVICTCEPCEKKLYPKITEHPPTCQCKKCKCKPCVYKEPWEQDAVEEEEEEEEGEETKFICSCTDICICAPCPQDKTKKTPRKFVCSCTDICICAPCPEEESKRELAAFVCSCTDICICGPCPESKVAEPKKILAGFVCSCIDVCICTPCPEKEDSKEIPIAEFVCSCTDICICAPCPEKQQEKVSFVCSCIDLCICITCLQSDKQAVQSSPQFVTTRSQIAANIETYENQREGVVRSEYELAQYDTPERIRYIYSNTAHPEMGSIYISPEGEAPLTSLAHPEIGERSLTPGGVVGMPGVEHPAMGGIYTAPEGQHPLASTQPAIGGVYVPPEGITMSDFEHPEMGGMYISPEGVPVGRDVTTGIEHPGMGGIYMSPEGVPIGRGVTPGIEHTSMGEMHLSPEGVPVGRDATSGIEHPAMGGIYISPEGVRVGRDATPGIEHPAMGGIYISPEGVPVGEGVTPGIEHPGMAGMYITPEGIPVEGGVMPGVTHPGMSGIYTAPEGVHMQSWTPGMPGEPNLGPTGTSMSGIEDIQTTLEGIPIIRLAPDGTPITEFTPQYGIPGDHGLEISGGMPGAIYQGPYHPPASSAATNELTGTVNDLGPVLPDGTTAIGSVGMYATSSGSIIAPPSGPKLIGDVSQALPGESLGPVYSLEGSRSEVGEKSPILVIGHGLDCDCDDCKSKKINKVGHLPDCQCSQCIAKKSQLILQKDKLDLEVKPTYSSEVPPFVSTEQGGGDDVTISIKEESSVGIVSSPIIEQGEDENKLTEEEGEELQETVESSLYEGGEFSDFQPDMPGYVPGELIIVPESDTTIHSEDINDMENFITEYDLVVESDDEDHPDQVKVDTTEQDFVSVEIELDVSKQSVERPCKCSVCKCCLQCQNIDYFGSDSTDSFCNCPVCLCDFCDKKTRRLPCKNCLCHECVCKDTVAPKTLSRKSIDNNGTTNDLIATEAPLAENKSNPSRILENIDNVTEEDVIEAPEGEKESIIEENVDNGSREDVIVIEAPLFGNKSTNSIYMDYSKSLNFDAVVPCTCTKCDCPSCSDANKRNTEELPSKMETICEKLTSNTCTCDKCVCDSCDDSNQLICDDKRCDCSICLLRKCDCFKPLPPESCKCQKALLNTKLQLKEHDKATSLEHEHSEECLCSKCQRKLCPVYPGPPEQPKIDHCECIRCFCTSCGDLCRMYGSIKQSSLSCFCIKCLCLDCKAKGSCPCVDDKPCECQVVDYEIKDSCPCADDKPCECQVVNCDPKVSCQCFEDKPCICKLTSDHSVEEFVSAVDILTKLPDAVWCIENPTKSVERFESTMGCLCSENVPCCCGS